MNDNKKQLEEWAELDTDSIDFDDLESKLDSELEEQMADLEGLESDREKIGNPDTIGHTVMNVVWEQFINQVGVVAGEDFIKENRGLTLDLRDSAHIQTTDNFAKDRKSTRLNSSHANISYAVFCLKTKTETTESPPPPCRSPTTPAAAGPTDDT